MKGNGRRLSVWEIEKYRVAIPQMIRAAFYGEDAAAFGVRLVGMGAMGAARLCCPLQPEMLRRIHACTAVRWQDAEAVYIPDENAERTGRLLFRVSYEFDGTDASGEDFSVRESAVVAVTCGALGGGLFWRGLCVSGVERCEERAGEISLPESPARARKRLSQRAADTGEFLGGCCLEGMLEIAFELLGELIGGILDGI